MICPSAPPTSSYSGGLYRGARSVLKKLPADCEGSTLLRNVALGVKQYIDESLPLTGENISDEAVAFVDKRFDNIESLYYTYFDDLELKTRTIKSNKKGLVEITNASDVENTQKTCFYCVVAAIYSHETLNCIISATKEGTHILCDQTPGNTFLFLTHLADTATIERVFSEFQSLLVGLRKDNADDERFTKEICLFILDYQNKKIFGFRPIFIDVDPNFSLSIKPLNYYTTPANFGANSTIDVGAVEDAYPDWQVAYMYYLWMFSLSRDQYHSEHSGKLSMLYRTSGQESVKGREWIWNAEHTQENARIFERGFIYPVDLRGGTLHHYADAGNGGVLDVIRILFKQTSIKNSDILAEVKFRGAVARSGKKRATTLDSESESESENDRATAAFSFDLAV